MAREDRRPPALWLFSVVFCAALLFNGAMGRAIPSSDDYKSQRRNLQQSITCPSNLACITSKTPTIPPYSTDLPTIPTVSGNLLSAIDPSTLINYAQSKLPQNAQDSITLGTNLLSQLKCGQSTLPIFSTETITSPNFLGSLSDGSCANINAVPGNNYLVGAMSTKAAAFISNLTSSKQQVVSSAKKAGKDYAACLAMDPCNGDYYLGFSGLSANWTVPLAELPPATLQVDFKSISYSKSGKNAGIQQTAIGLWTYDQAANANPPPVSILGNLDAQFGVTLSWGYVVNNVKVATISLVGNVETVVKFSNPTIFALQTSATPMIDIYDSGILKIDLSKLNGAIKSNMLFYVNHQDATNYDVYAGVQVNANINTLVSALPGPLGSVLADIISADSSLQANLNLHMDQNGAGLRIAFSGNVGLADPIANVIKVFAPNAPTRFSTGLAVKLLIVPINGQKKVFGFVDIGGTEWSFATCSSNSDCMSGQYCYVGVCAPQVGCLASQGRDYVGDVSFVGVCPSGNPGTTQFGRCYQNCKSGYVTGNLGDISRICYEDCTCGTEFFGASLCSNQVSTVFGPVCDAFSARSRGWYDRTVDNVCPSGSSPVATTCWGNCPAGWVTGTTGDVSGRSSALNCYMSQCPPDFPTMCLSGLTQVCVKSGVSCSSPEVIGALWGKCGGTPPTVPASLTMMNGVVKPQCKAGAYLGPDMGCKICGPGQYCKGGTYPPLPCTKNHYCPANTTTPIACPATAPFSPAGSTSVSACAVCQPGNYFDAKTGTCLGCPKGAYCPGTDGSIKQCPPASFCPALSSTTTPCPFNSTTRSFMWSPPGSSDASVCVSCPAGSLWNAPGFGPATGYANPSYKGDINATCKLNPAGQYSDIGAVSTVPCPGGLFCPAGAPVNRCPNNTWSAAGAVSASDCKAPSCPAGQFMCGGGANVPGKLGTCCPCPNGYYCPGGTGLAQATAFTMCPAGTSTNGGASSAAGCLKCPGSSVAAPLQRNYNYQFFDYQGKTYYQVGCIQSSFGSQYTLAPLAG